MSGSSHDPMGYGGVHWVLVGFLRVYGFPENVVCVSIYVNTYKNESGIIKRPQVTLIGSTPNISIFSLVLYTLI